jgi:hypothetical protein
MLDIVNLYGTIVNGGEAAKNVWQTYADLLSQYISVDNLLNRRTLT